jgi:hypothetical protein
METILAIPDDGDKRIPAASFGGGLSRIYRSYRKASECVYAEWGKEVQPPGEESI